MAKTSVSAQLKRLQIAGRTKSGRAASYVDPRTGEEFTAYAVRVARNNGVPPHYNKLIKKTRHVRDRQRAESRHERIGYLLDRYVEHAGIEGKRITKTQAIKSKEFWKVVNDLGTADDAPRGKKARALVALGLRHKDAPTLVGNSPPAMGQYSPAA